MLPSLDLLRHQLGAMIDTQARQGHAVEGLRERLARTEDSYDALAALGEELASAPLRSVGGTVPTPRQEEDLASAGRAVAAAASDDVATAARAEGAELTQRQAVDLALDLAREPGDRTT